MVKPVTLPPGCARLSTKPLELEQLLDRGLELVRSAEGRTKFEAEVDAFDPASLPQADDETTQAGGRAVGHAPSGQFVVERQSRQRGNDPHAI
ncbi:hypothetical protein ACVIU4_006778 [Bradyrhizobium barranii subsp. barranii]|nr:hypothetical protein [Bradyrhizobium japonicum]MCP1958969.1 hypothetical protein [Bradyrhizobium japonicum]